jgi:uncharacterized protein YukE
MASVRMRDETLSAIAGSLAQCAEQIEGTFVRVGEQLGDGLALFETVSESLGAVSGEMSSDELDDAGEALRRLGDALRRFGNGLSAETEALQEIAAHNAAASRALCRLGDHVRLIAILARGARIEAASVPSSRGDLGAFAGKIVALTGKARATVDDCGRDHDRLSGLIDDALGRQQDFVAQYRDELASVAQRLERSVAALAEGKARSVALSADAAAHSAKISMAVGGAIIAMQSGDSIRQRLEHCLTGLRLVCAAAADSRPCRGGTGGARVALERVLRRLEAVQLRETALALKGDVGEIDSALCVVADETGAMIRLGRSFAGDDQESSQSCFDRLEAELAQAGELLEKCDAARGGVDRANAALASLLDRFLTTVASLSETVRDIVMIGTNAGLVAARLGGDGLGLVVIAGEIKAVADHIARDADDLAPVIGSMQTALATLRDRERRGGYDSTILDRTMRRSLGQMRESGARLAEALERLTGDGASFATIVGEGRRMFSRAADSADAIAEGAEALDDERPAEIPLDPAEAADVAALLREQVWPAYTMAAERDLHRRVLEEFALEGGERPAVAAMA